LIINQVFYFTIVIDKDFLKRYFDGGLHPLNFPGRKLEGAPLSVSPDFSAVFAAGFSSLAR